MPFGGASAAPSPAGFAGDLSRSRIRGYEVPAYAGMTVMGDAGTMARG